MNKKNSSETAEKALSKMELQNLESAIDSHEISDDDLNMALLSAVDKSVLEASNISEKLSSNFIISADEVHGFSDNKIQSIVNTASGSDVPKEILDIIMHHMPKISSDN
jgi:hypothetical protein